MVFIKPDRINTVEGSPIAIKIKMIERWVSMRPRFLISKNRGMTATFRGSMIPLKKSMYIQVRSLYLYLETPYEAMEPRRITNAIEINVTNMLFLKYNAKPRSTQTILKFSNNQFSGKPKGFAKISRVVLKEEIIMLKRG
jgi:hypothetical protein